MSDLINTFMTVLNPADNGGESVIVTTKVFDNGDYNRNSRYTETTIELHSYGRSASLNIGDAFDNGMMEEHLQTINN